MYLCAERIERLSGRPVEHDRRPWPPPSSRNRWRRTRPVRSSARASSTAWSGAVDDVDLRALGLRVGQRHHGAGHADHVAVGGDVHALPGEHDAFVDLGRVGDAHRAAGPHDDVEAARERRRAGRTWRSPARGCRTRASPRRARVRGSPVTRPSASTMARARSGSRNFSSRTRPARQAAASSAPCRVAAISPRTSAAIRSSCVGLP